MTALYAFVQTSTPVAKWFATLLALAMATLHPASRRSQDHHRLPVTLPELASATQSGRMR